ncbi:hypothetical protein ACVW0I_001902 [Bradyrhizobium sp. LM6.11]
MSEGSPRRTLDDLLRVVRALAYEFETDTVFVVGSQAILASMPDAPEAARESPEIDAFPANARIWELTEAKRTRDGVQPIASEHIDGLFGSESPLSSHLWLLHRWCRRDDGQAPERLAEPSA